MKNRILPLLLVFMIWAPALAQAPSPKQMHERLDEQKSFQLRLQVENIRLVVLDRLDFTGDRKLRGHYSFFTDSYDPESFSLAQKQFTDAGWNCSLTTKNDMTTVEIWE